MRFVRRASLVFSVVLVVAIAVGYWARTAEVHRSRDLRLETSARVAAAELASLVDQVAVAARVGGDPAVVADALSRVEPGIGVCVLGDVVACEGADRDLADRFVERREFDRGVGTADVTTSADLLTIDVVGAGVDVVVAVPTDPHSSVFAATHLPAGAVVGSVFGEEGARQAVVPVPGGAPILGPVYAVASETGVTTLPRAELNFYLIVSILAVILFLLAGITLVVEHRSLVERASFDALTRLPNRAEFERRSVDLLDPAAGTTSCLLVFDLDGFKAVNDTYGHHAGDEMLKVVGERLRRAVRPTDLVGRWGGDEFVVLLHGVATTEMGSRRARALAEQIGGRTRLEGIDEPLRVKASVGIALLGVHGNDLGALVEAADRAMYEAKRNRLVSSVAIERDAATLTPA